MEGCGLQRRRDSRDLGGSGFGGSLSMLSGLSL